MTLLSVHPKCSGVGTRSVSPASWRWADHSSVRAAAKNERRLCENLPTNFGVAEAGRLDVVAVLSNLAQGQDIDISSKVPQLRRLLVDESQLQLSSVVLGSGAAGKVVEGSYQGREVRCSCLGVYPLN